LLRQVRDRQVAQLLLGSMHRRLRCADWFACFCVGLVYIVQTVCGCP
jgi:hypothetical protein